MPKILSKKDVKGAVIEVIEPFAEAVQSDFIKVNKRLDKVEFELGEVKKEVRGMKENTSELFTKLDEFITLYKKHEQELLILGEQLRRLDDRVSRLETKQLHS